ncbi:MAG: prepilin-type N-terminal cleavage/methylation domain-containing protein [Verrucomicrobiota bacterium JB023]|nr:prepilin-type N-terminal cleavage/methylation domain-containing protein [Verrucomicrobiota bacterium JB023]
MKLTNTQINSKRGMTLLELTVVILVLLSLISILFVGARAWKKGSDRAGAIMVIRNAQQGVRAAANMKGIQPHETSWLPYAGVEADDSPSAGLETVVFKADGSGYVTVETDGAVPTHPADGSGVTFAFGQDAGATVPPLGSLYIDSSDADYSPDSTVGW